MSGTHGAHCDVIGAHIVRFPSVFGAAHGGQRAPLAEVLEYDLVDDVQ